MRIVGRSVLARTYTDFRSIVVDGCPGDSVPGWFGSLGVERVGYEFNETSPGANGNRGPGEGAGRRTQSPVLQVACRHPAAEGGAQGHWGCRVRSGPPRRPATVTVGG
ncbi:hypothetical protein PROPJV5_2122 [Propionibacterium ruminifibrarum]|uniref:Uncharacterized protein n=1 Tax=Propionibacterium ruminifibrarum TaxID=1962131 RepID=A0A375I4X6_9ACTN|nr:hypothetical protein PROPJV5_2122 [Propionibacterium ruminifibrarum]